VIGRRSCQPSGPHSVVMDGCVVEGLAVDGSRCNVTEVDMSELLVICNEEDTDGRARVSADEEWVLVRVGYSYSDFMSE